MKRKKKMLLPIIILFVIIGALGAALYFSSRIVPNPDGTVGNTAGNLNNSGLFCEYGGKVYFSNVGADGGLFVMNPDETEPKRLNSLKVQNILAGGSYLYYFQTGSVADSGFGQLEGVKSFERCGLKGGRSTALTRDVVVTAQLVDNYLYLLTSPSSGISFYKMKIDKTDKTILADYIINPACAENGVIYYNGTQRDHYLYALNTKTGVSSELWRGNLWYPVLQGDYVYYLSPEDNYKLCRYSFSQNLIEILTQDRVDCFNIGGGFLYYQKNGSQPQLKCMRTDGSDVKILAEGNYTNINITSQYVYFQPFGNESVMYHSPLGSSYYDSFQVLAK